MNSSFIKNEVDMNDIDKRKENRLDVYWKVFYGEHLWGYVLDLSLNGIRMILNKDHISESDEFLIRIRPPKELDFADVELQVKKIWVKDSNSKKFYEVGCEFGDLSSEQSSKLDKMYHYFIDSNWIESIKSELEL